MFAGVLVIEYSPTINPAIPTPAPRLVANREIIGISMWVSRKPRKVMRMFRGKAVLAWGILILIPSLDSEIKGRPEIAKPKVFESYSIPDGRR